MQIAGLSTQRRFERTDPFVRGRFYRLCQSRCLRCTGHRLPPLQAGFKHAALVACACFGTVFVAQMHLNPGDFVFEVAQRMFDLRAHVFGGGFMACGAVVSVGLNVLGKAFER